MLIVDEPTKTIFLHNPKCGGSFIKRMYLNRNPNYPEPLHRLRNRYDIEINVHGAHIDYYNLPRFIPDYKDYKLISFIRNPYNRFVSAMHWSAGSNPKIKQLMQEYLKDIKKICQHLISLDYTEQDSYLRNYNIPWTMPQSRFSGQDIITLKYESKQDWNFLLNLYNINNAEIKIKEDYSIDAETKKMIRQLYYDDEEIFDQYPWI